MSDRGAWPGAECTAVEEETKGRVRGPSKCQEQHRNRDPGCMEHWELGWSRVRLREAGPHKLLRHLGRAKERCRGERLDAVGPEDPKRIWAKPGERCLAGPA